MADEALVAGRRSVRSVFWSAGADGRDVRPRLSNCERWEQHRRGVGSLYAAGECSYARARVRACVLQFIYACVRARSNACCAALRAMSARVRRELRWKVA
eukprot:5153925-Pleurochrysis_carterae.AAC.1